MRPPEYQTQRFTLRAYSAEDEDRFVEIGLDPLSSHFMGGATGDEEDERRMFRKVLEIYDADDKKRWFWIWGIYEGEKLCGHFELKETEHTSDSELEIVYMIHPEERRRGVIKEVFQLFKEIQSEWDKRIIATVSPKNEASVALLQKWGIERKEVVEPDDGGKPYMKLWLQ